MHENGYLNNLFGSGGYHSPAFAANPEVVYKSGILTNVFIGVFALIVVSQLVPVLMLIMRFIKTLMRSVEQRMVASSRISWMSGVHHQSVSGLGDEEEQRKEAPVAKSTPNKVNYRKEDLPWVIR